MHRVIRTARQAGSRLLWALRSRRLAPPSLPTQATSALFVCTGNICRSPFAEILARRIAAGRGWTAFRAASAGLVPSRDGASPPDAVTAAGRLGIDLTAHRPVGLTDTLIEGHDVIVVMDWGHLVAVRTRWPDQSSKVVLLSMLAPDPPGDAYARLNIPDPFGRGPEAFEQCYARLTDAVTRLVAEMQDARRA